MLCKHVMRIKLTVRLMMLSQPLETNTVTPPPRQHLHPLPHTRTHSTTEVCRQSYFSSKQRCLSRCKQCGLQCKCVSTVVYTTVEGSDSSKAVSPTGSCGARARPTVHRVCRVAAYVGRVISRPRSCIARTSALSQGGMWLSQGGLLPDMSPWSWRVIGLSNTGLRRV